jgi:RNA polymerase sigma-70 factor (ECF subfamily)
VRGTRRQLSDEDLVRAGRAGDTEAFGEIVSRYKDRIYNLAYRMFGNREEAEDIAQETFLHIFRALGSFRVEERFSPWIYRIATNLCLDRLRKMKHAVASLDAPAGPEGDIPQQVADWSHAPEKVYELSEMRADTQEAINALPPKYKVVVVLRHLQDLSYDEIARVLGIPQGTVKTRLFRAREILRRRLGKLYPVAGGVEESAVR